MPFGVTPSILMDDISTPFSIRFRTLRRRSFTAKFFALFDSSILLFTVSLVESPLFVSDFVDLEASLPIRIISLWPTAKYI